MKKLRAQLVVTALLSTFVVAPLASAANTPPIDCSVPVADHAQATTFDYHQVAFAAQELQRVSGAEVYVRGVSEFSNNMTTHYYNQLFLETCNPPTDYILVVADQGRFAYSFYGSHFDRLEPVLFEATGRYVKGFHDTTQVDKTRPIVSLLEDLSWIFRYNPGHDDYNTYPKSYIPVALPDTVVTPSSEPDRSQLYALGGVVGTCILIIVLAIIGMIRDKKDHNSR